MKNTTNKRRYGLLALGLPLLAPIMYSQDDDDNDIVELSPFSVDATEDTGYRAANTLAGTRIRTDLKDVGTAISVVTEQFLKDTGATDNESLLIYTMGTEVGGSSGNFAGGGDGGRVDSDSQRRAPNSATRVRGLSEADNTRDFFVTDIPWDSFNVGRIDIQRGANSVLFGLGSPAGIINAGLKNAIFSDEGQFEAKFGSHGTWRASVDFNKVILEDELAFRFSALEEDQQFQQAEAFEKDTRYFLSGAWKPSFLQSDGTNGMLTVNYENGKIDANRPRVIPPIDRITPWFDSMDKATYNSNELSPSPTPYIGNEALGRLFDGPVAVYDGSGTPSSFFMAQMDGTKYAGIDDFSDYSKQAGLEFSGIGGYKSKTLVDPSIFNFYDHLIDGPNKSEWQEWDAYNIAYSQNWLDNKLGLELVLDSQEYEDGQTNILDNFGQSISVDVVSVLPDGSPNPNVGRAIVGGDAQNNNRRTIDRDTFRATGYYEYDFRDSGNDRLDFLGRHVFTGLYSTQEVNKLDTTWIRNVSTGINDTASITQANRYLSTLAYLSPSLAGLDSAAGANIQPISQRLMPTGGQINTDNGIVNMGVLSYDNGDLNSLYKQANLSKDKIESTAFIWQGWLFDGLVVPMFAYRDDTADAGNAGDATAGIENGSVNPFDSSWTVPGSQSEATNSNSYFETEAGVSKTYSVVFHAPQSLSEKLGGIDLSLSCSESSNFRPDASRRSILGSQVLPETGDTKEYGLNISALDGKFNLKINRFQTNVTRATLSGSSIANSYMIGAGEGWGYMFAKWADEGEAEFSRNFALVDIDDPNSGLINPDVPVLRYEPAYSGNETPAEMAAMVAATKVQQDAALAAIFATGNRPSDSVLAYWGQDLDGIEASNGWDDGGKAWNGEPDTFKVTSDFVSKGWEYELFYQPTNNWNIALNAAKVDSKRTNIASSYSEYVNERWALYKGAYGDVRLWNGFAGGETIGSKYGGEFYSNYLLNVLLDNSQVPELRPWRANLVTNYSFTEGKLKGLSVGGSVRWQDKVVTGYHAKYAEEANAKYNIEVGDPIYDVNNPFYGSSETNIDFWAGYGMPISDRIDWRIQLNVSNAFTGDELIPITVNVDGSAATSRIAPPRTWTLSNTFSF